MLTPQYLIQQNSRNNGKVRIYVPRVKDSNWVELAGLYILEDVGTHSEDKDRERS